MNLYWPVFCNIENELIEITRTIHFCDEQLDTYSTRLSDLLLRICVEVESISKELFNSLFQIGDKCNLGQDNKRECTLQSDGEWKYVTKSGQNRIINLYFDHNCIKKLNDRWNIGDREVVITSSNMFFKLDENKRILPLSKFELTQKTTSNTKGGWLQAYQAVKHSRIKAQKQGNVYNVIHALAALYILNIYYIHRGSVVITNSFDDQKKSDLTYNSSIFSTTIGTNINNIFLLQFNNDIEINKNQLIKYVVYNVERGEHELEYGTVRDSDGSEIEVIIPRTRKQDC